MLSISCTDLLELESFQYIKLIAGKEGLYRGVSWPFICTTPTITQWVYGGELLFITGAGIESGEEGLLSLMQEGVEKSLSGMVILKGDEFIPTIPSSLIDLANQLSFPLFEMPWTLKLIDVTQEISQLIMKHQNQSKRRLEFLEKLLFSDSMNQNFDELSMHNDIVPRSLQFITIIGIENSFNQELTAIRSDIIRTLGKNTINKSYEIICMDYNNTVVCLCLANTEHSLSILKSSIIKTFNILEKRYPRIMLQLGFGRDCKDGDNIQQSYVEAKRIITLMNQNILPGNTFHYKDLGIFRLLFEIKDTNKIKDYCTENIGKLMEADEKNNSELLKTLHSYLLNNCNLLQTSKSLFIHRNTLTYRLNLISDIIGKDLDDAHVRHELYLSIIASQFLKMIK